MTTIFKLLGSFFLVLLTIQLSFSQSKYLPTAFRIGADVTGVGHTFFSSNYWHYEINSDLEFGKYFFAFDVGHIERGYYREYSYNSSGNFFRAGLDYNFIPDDPDNNLIFVGLRYGRAYFSDYLNYELMGGRFGDEQYNLGNERVRGRWLEAVAGMKIRVWNRIFLGYTLRYKFARKINGENSFTSYEIPGYGRAAGSSNFGFNYHIFYRLPF